MKNREHYNTLAKLFQYPTEGYKESAVKVAELLKDYPEGAEEFGRFLDFTTEKSLFEIEEVFGITFHIQAICFLDMGYVLFGDDS